MPFQKGDKRKFEVMVPLHVNFFVPFLFIYFVICDEERSPRRMAPPKRPSFRVKTMVKVIHGRYCGEGVA